MKNMCRHEQGKFVWSSHIPVFADSMLNLEEAVTSWAPFHKPALFIKADREAMLPKYVLKHIEHAGHWVSTTLDLRHDIKVI